MALRLWVHAGIDTLANLELVLMEAGVHAVGLVDPSSLGMAWVAPGTLFLGAVLH